MRGPRSASKNRKQWDGNVYGLKLIGQGGTGFVFAIDDARAAKIPIGSEISNRAFEREHTAFSILSEEKPNQYVIQCLDLRFRDGLVLERCVKTVRECLQEQNVEGHGGIPRWEDTALMEQSLTWASQAAQGISFLHCKGIIHADVGCHNLLLDTRGNVKVADFSGSVINYPGATSPMDALVCYDVRCRRPGASKATEQTDIFALGSVIYELATGHLPYSDLRDTDVEECFDRRAWPGDLAQVASTQPAAVRTIRRCWEGQFSTAKEVATNLKSAAPAYSHYIQHLADIKHAYKGERTGTEATFSSSGGNFNEKKHWRDPPATRKSPRPKKNDVSFNKRFFSWIRGSRY